MRRETDQLQRCQCAAGDMKGATSLCGVAIRWWIADGDKKKIGSKCKTDEKPGVNAGRDRVA